MTTRQQRRAAARAQAKAALTSSERVDPTRLQMFLSANGKVQAAQQALVEAQGALKHATEEIRTAHQMKDGDSFDIKTGLIVRRAKRSRKSKR